MIVVNRSSKLAFSLIFRDINRITTCKTTVTAEAGRLSSKASSSVYGEVGQGIRADFCCDLLHGMEPAGKDFSHKSVSFKMLKDPITGYRDPTAFLSPVLQCVQPEINILCYVFPAWRPYSKHTTFFMHCRRPPK